MEEQELTVRPPYEQVPHYEHGFVRYARHAPFADITTRDLRAALSAIAYEFGLPHDLPVPPSGLPGIGSREINDQAMALIREGVRYLVAIADGEKRTLWNIHDRFANELQSAYDRGRNDLAASMAEKSVADARRRDRERAGAEAKAMVYFIQSGDQEIKIGKAVDPDKRLRELQTSHFRPLSVVATCKGGLQLEYQYHQRFAEHRLHGEWFSPHPDILAEIERLNG